MQPAQTQREMELNIFARWFGNLLVELKTHDLRMTRQSRERMVYSQEPNIEFIEHIR